MIVTSKLQWYIPFGQKLRNLLIWVSMFWILTIPLLKSVVIVETFRELKTELTAKLIWSSSSRNWLFEKSEPLI